ncbi:SRPBCC family protein [Conexibacter woesei]|nr:SRPBCC domain-containing protein [Conexibacter woesei]
MTDATPARGHDDDLRVIEVDEFFSHSPERVWAALTEPALMRQWLMETDFRPQLGHRFTFHAPPNPKTGFSGEIACEVLEIEPCRRLRISWNDAIRRAAGLDGYLDTRAGGARHAAVHRARRLRPRRRAPAARPHDHGRRLAFGRAATPHRAPRSRVARLTTR